MKLASVLRVCSGLCLMLPSVAMALAAVESRTGEPRAGEPVVRSSTPVIVQGADDRVARLNTLKQIETLQQEISELRGLVETQDHEIQKLKKSQQDFYIDLDKRLNELKPSGKSKAIAVSSTEEAPTPEPVLATAKASEAPIAPSTATEKELYSKAYNAVRTKQYSEAITGFQEYLTYYPQGEQAPNAHYWLGEVYMAEWQAEKTNRGLLDKATQSFIHIKTQYPQHSKVADALLKLGLIETEKNNLAVAKGYLTEVKKRYPNSAAARIADARLKQLP